MQTQEIPNYRNQIRRALPAEFFKPDYSNFIWLPIHALIIGAGLWLLKDHFSFWTAPLIALVIGHSFGCLGFWAHDVCHGGTVKNLFLRDLLAGIGFSPFFISPRLWRRWHNADHHTHTQVEGVDPDHLFTMEEYEKSPILQWMYRLSPLVRNLVIFSSFAYRMEQQQIRMVLVYTFKSKKVGTFEKVVIWSQLLTQLGLWVGVTAMMGSQVLIWGYLVPLLVANTIVISYIATNHFLNPLGDEHDILATSLTVTLPKALQWLDPVHSHFGAHVAHHLFPQAAARRTRQIETKAQELFPDRYHAMPLFTALRMLWRTPWVYENKTTFIDPVRDLHIPTLGHGMEELIPGQQPHQITHAVIDTGVREGSEDEVAFPPHEPAAPH